MDDDTSSIIVDYIKKNFDLTNKYFLKTDTIDNKNIIDFFNEKSDLFDNTFAGEDKNEKIKELKKKIKDLKKKKKIKKK